MRSKHTINLIILAILISSGAAIVVPLPASAADPPSPSAKYEKEIAAFEAMDRKSPPPAGAVLFVGDSGIRMWKSLADDFSDQKVINRGFGGSTMADAVYFADRIVIPYKPRLIIVREGGNDLTTGVTPEQLLTQFQAFVTKVRSALPGVRIAFFSLNPNPARWNQADMRKRANAMIREYVAKEKNLDFIEVWDQFLGPDGKPRDELFIKDRLHNNAE
jgi:lysophospholipase L1-like esterase